MTSTHVHVVVRACQPFVCLISRSRERLQLLSSLVAFHTLYPDHEWYFCYKKVQAEFKLSKAGILN